MLSIHSLPLDPKEENVYYALSFNGHRIHLHCDIVCIIHKSCTIECVSRAFSLLCAGGPKSKVGFHLLFYIQQIYHI